MRIKINIVLPLAVACTAPGGDRPDASLPMAAHYPALPTGGGPTLVASRLVSVTFSADPRADDLDDFVGWLASSGWLTDAAGEYGVEQVAGAAPISLTDAPPAVLTTEDVKALVAGEVADAGFASAAPGEAPYVYVLFLPDSTVLIDTQSNLCRTNPGSGLHDSTDGPGPKVQYVVVPSCPPRFSSQLSVIESTELDAARLVIDTVTDPSPRDEPAFALTDTSSPWTALGHETGDFCWGRLFVRDGRHLQRTWSNVAAAAGQDACAPASGNSVFGVSVAPGVLQTLSVGVDADFTVTGWSQSAINDWTLRVTPWVGDFAVTAQLDRSTLNDGQTAHLTISVPFAVPSGTYGAALIQSVEDQEAPQWPVSFVVQ